MGDWNEVLNDELLSTNNFLNAAITGTDGN
jgi:hypothetical protein